MDRRVEFQTSDHFSILTQLHGSVWGHVLPFCILNIGNIFLASYVKRNYLNQYGLGISLSAFQSSLSIVIAFLSVTRVRIAFDQFVKHRAAIQQMARASRNIVFYSVAFTRKEHSEKAKQWRLNVARETMALLRLAVTALQFQSTGRQARMSPALTNEERTVLLQNTGNDNERAAYVITMFLQTIIASHDEHLSKPLHENFLLNLYSYVNEYIKAYNDIHQMLDTGLPFPVVQMTRTIVFLYVFALPWILYDGEHAEVNFVSSMIYCFFVTYAFIGLELVSIEMDDPFGDDQNDLDILSLYEKVFKDIIMCIEDIDGNDNAYLLKKYSNVVKKLDESTRNLKFGKDNSSRSFDEEGGSTPLLSGMKSVEKKSHLFRRASNEDTICENTKRGLRQSSDSVYIDAYGSMSSLISFGGQSSNNSSNESDTHSTSSSAV